MLFELAAEIGGAFKPRLRGDGGDAFFRRCEQFRRPRQPVFDQVGEGGGADALAEDLQGAVLADLYGGGDVLQRDRLPVPFVDILNHQL